MATPIHTRKADLAYLAFFVIHLPIMFLVDLTAFYPASVHATVPLFSKIRTYYATTYKDRFFSATVPPPFWFKVFIGLEAIYHVPLTLWAIPALLRDDPQVPLQLLVFALEAALTTLPCLAEVISWNELNSGEKTQLLAMYGSYLAVSVAMGVDCFLRIRRTLRRSNEISVGKKTV